MVFLLATVGCAGGGPGRPAPPDAAGAAEAEAAALAPLWRLEDAPLVAVGGPRASGEFALDRVVSVAPWGDGFMVASAAGSEVRFFDEGGRHVRTLEQVGEEPLRFRGVRLLQELEDGRILIADPEGDRVVLSRPDGSYAEAYPLGGKRAAGALSDGRVVTSEGPFGVARRIGPGLTTTIGRVRLLDPASGTSVTLDSTRSSTWYRAGGRSLQVPWTTRLLHAAGADRIAVGWSGEPEIRVFDAEGGLLHTVRWAQERRAISDEELERFVARAPEDGRDSLRALLRARPQDLFDQIFQMLLVDDEGNVWVLLEDVPGGRAGRWLKFDENGEAEGYVELPRRIRVWSINRGRVLYTWWEDGIPTVRLYETTTRR